MSFWKDISPSGAVSDLLSYLREKRDHNLLFIIAACLPPAIMIYTFQTDANRKSIPPPPQVVYFESWPATRSRDESLQAITKRQLEKDVYLEKKRQDYEKLGRMIGMDVEQIKREAARIKADARAAAAKAAAQTNAPLQPGAKTGAANPSNISSAPTGAAANTDQPGYAKR